MLIVVSPFAKYSTMGMLPAHKGECTGIHDSGQSGAPHAPFFWKLAHDAVDAQGRGGALLEPTVQGDPDSEPSAIRRPIAALHQHPSQPAAPYSHQRAV